MHWAGCYIHSCKFLAIFWHRLCLASIFLFSLWSLRSCYFITADIISKWYYYQNEDIPGSKSLQNSREKLKNSNRLVTAELQKRWTNGTCWPFSPSWGNWPIWGWNNGYLGSVARIVKQHHAAKRWNLAQTPWTLNTHEAKPKVNTTTPKILSDFSNFEWVFELNNTIFQNTTDLQWNLA